MNKIFCEMEPNGSKKRGVSFGIRVGKRCGNAIWGQSWGKQGNTNHLRTCLLSSLFLNSWRQKVRVGDVYAVCDFYKRKHNNVRCVYS